MELQWKKILTQASEDVKNYLHAIKLWSKPTNEYKPDYILILVLTNRARIRHIISLSKNIPSTYSKDKKKLTALWSKAEEMLKTDILHNTEQVRNIISNKFIQRLNYIGDDLKRVRHIAHDGDLTGDYDWIAENLREAALDFLLDFRDMAFIKDELKELNFQSIDEFYNKFNGIEELFKKYFGYFHTVGDLLSSIREREYGMDYWWLNKEPAIKEEEIPENIMKELIGIYKSADVIAHENCPETELVIAYALREITSDESINIQNHVLKCRSCLDLVTDIRYADVVSKEEKLDEASKKYFKEVRDNLLKESKGVEDKTKNIMKPVIMEPRLPYRTPDITIPPAFMIEQIRQIQISAYQRITAAEEERGLITSLQINNAIKLNLKAEKGKYKLPDSPAEKDCDSPGDYEKIKEFIINARPCWGGFAIKGNNIIERFKPDFIKLKTLSRLIEIDKNKEYEYLIIGIAGNKDDVEKGLKFIEEKNEKGITSLNIIWLICTLLK